MRAHQTRNRAVAVLCALMIFSQPAQFARADEKDDAILRQSGKVAGKEVARRGMDHYLGNIAQSKIGYGAGVLSAVAIGLSVKDFVDAETDVGRAHATAQTAVGVVSLVNPVIGLVAAAVVMVYEVIEGSVAVQHEAHMMELEAHIQESLAEIRRIDSQFAQKEIVSFSASLTAANEAKAQIHASAKYLKENCTGPDIFNDLERVDACVEHLSAIVSLQRIEIDRLSELLEFKSKYISLDAVFQQAKINRQLLLKAIAFDREQLQQNSEKISGQLKEFARGLADALRRKVDRENSLTIADSFVGTCVTDMEDYVQRVARFELSGVRSGNPELKKIIAGVDRRMLETEGREISERGCGDLNASLPILNSQYSQISPVFTEALQDLFSQSGSSNASTKSDL